MLLGTSKCARCHLRVVAHCDLVSVPGRGPDPRLLGCCSSLLHGETRGGLCCRVGGGGLGGERGSAAQNPPSIGVAVTWGPLLAPHCPGHVASPRSCLRYGRWTRLSTGRHWGRESCLPRAPTTPAKNSVCPRLWSLSKLGRVCCAKVPVQTRWCREPRALSSVSLHARSFPTPRGYNGCLVGSVHLPKHAPPVAALNMSLLVILLADAAVQQLFGSLSH